MLQYPSIRLAASLLLAGCLLPGAAHAQFTVEGFDSIAADTTSVSLTGVNVSLTGLMAVRASPPNSQFGSGPSVNWIGNALNSAVPATRSIGVIDATTPGVGFEVKSVYLWTSQNGGNENAPATITMTGTSLAGTMITHTLLITPTGFTGNDYIHVTFPAAWVPRRSRQSVFTQSV